MAIYIFSTEGNTQRCFEFGYRGRDILCTLIAVENTHTEKSGSIDLLHGLEYKLFRSTTFGSHMMSYLVEYRSTDSEMKNSNGEEHYKFLSSNSCKRTKKGKVKCWAHENNGGHYQRALSNKPWASQQHVFHCILYKFPESRISKNQTSVLTDLQHINLFPFIWGTGRVNRVLSSCLDFFQCYRNLAGFILFHESYK